MLQGILQLNHESLPLTKCQQTSNIFERMRGLIGRPEPIANESLWITRCNSIHTFFMRYTIDVIFINTKGVVLKVSAHVAPWRLRMCFSAKSVLELRAGDAEKLGLTVGSYVEFLPKR